MNLLKHFSEIRTEHKVFVALTLAIFLLAFFLPVAQHESWSGDEIEVIWGYGASSLLLKPPSIWFGFLMNMPNFIIPFVLTSSFFMKKLWLKSLTIFSLLLQLYWIGIPLYVAFNYGTWQLDIMSIFYQKHILIGYWLWLLSGLLTVWIAFSYRFTPKTGSAS